MERRAEEERIAHNATKMVFLKNYLEPFCHFSIVDLLIIIVQKHRPRLKEKWNLSTGLLRHQMRLLGYRYLRQRKFFRVGWHFTHINP